MGRGNVPEGLALLESRADEGEVTWIPWADVPLLHQMPTEPQEGTREPWPPSQGEDWVQPTRRFRWQVSMHPWGK